MKAPGFVRRLLSVLLLFAGPPVSAQNLCIECLRAADQELKACIKNAISIEDTNACEDKREDQLRTCEDSECKVEREDRETSGDAPSQDR
jgi:hypothetical protein